MRWTEHVARMGREEEHTGFWWRNLRESDYLGDPDVGGRIILKCMYMYWDDGMNLIDLAQNRDRLRALVTAVMNLRVP